MARSFGWSAYGPGPGSVPSAGSRPDGDLRPELADVGRLARRGLRAVVGAARADERPSLSRILSEHLGAGAGAYDVVEETWPGYEHVNVQAGLDAWLADPRRTSELVGITNFQHAMFGLGDLLADEGRHDPMGLRPGNPATVNLACGPDGEVRPCQRCAVYLVGEGEVRTALLVRGASPEFGNERVSLQIVSNDPAAAARVAARDPGGGARAQRLPGAGALVRLRRCSATGRRCCSSTGGPTLTADQLILRAETLAEVQRQVVGGGPAQGPAARGRPAPQAGPAPLRAAREPGRPTRCAT